MWLLSAARAELEFFNDPEDVPHPGICILSHTWGKTKDEQTFQEINAIRKDCEATGANPRDHVSENIRKCCELAEQHGYEWVWIDTCCIDKTSSAELTEAINSMFRYYSLSGVCFVYLADVSARCSPLSRDHERSFWTSGWHRRGWTLQELIAPRNLQFSSQDWTLLELKTNNNRRLADLLLKTLIGLFILHTLLTYVLMSAHAYIARYRVSLFP